MITAIRSELRRRWTNLRYNSGAPAAKDRRAARATSAASLARERDVHLLVAPPGQGNIGDQALFEAFIENAPGNVLAIVRRTADFDVPEELKQRVTLLAMPALIYGEGNDHARAIAELSSLLHRALSLSIIGADIMDGRYSLRGSVRRSVIAELGASAGVDTRIVGFSWASNPRSGAKRALVKASRAGAVPMLRDPFSAQRATDDGVMGVRLVSDLVFAATLTAESPITPPGPYAVVNASGLIGRSLDQVTAYRRIIAHLRSRGLHVVLVPHVIKPLSDDLRASLRIADAVGESGVTLVTHLLTPGQIRSLTADARITVTGRMHLAIMSFLGGTPAVTMATQGKVEGLMDLFGIRQLCVRPGPWMASGVIAAIDDALPDRSAPRRAIAGALPGVTLLALENVAGLGDAPRRVDVVDAHAGGLR
ncbi:polysaccharide pyruvyl transferase family protein [Glaciibacter flavus]|uniref:polysaccharide pyruvyl transferase family protein n=1 Tax=Orlajensenia flava TaxID=2565934 RepID=UPI003B004EEB